MLNFAELDNKTVVYKYAVLVTSLEDEVVTIAQHYRDRTHGKTGKVKLFLTRISSFFKTLNELETHLNWTYLSIIYKPITILMRLK